VSKTPKFSHITLVLKSLHWLIIKQRIQHKVISLTYKTLQSNKPIYLNDLLHIQRNRNTRSSDIVTLERPSAYARLKLTDRIFTHHAPLLWNSLPLQLQLSASSTQHQSNRLHSGFIFVSVSCETQNVPLQPIILVGMHNPLCQFSGFLTRQCSSSHIHCHSYHSLTHHSLL